MRSEVLGLELRCEQDVLRFYDPTEDTYLLSHSETEQARREAEARAERELAARQAAEAQVAELEARLRALAARQDPEMD